MKRGLDIIKALLDGTEEEQINRCWVTIALLGESCDTSRRESWIVWRLRHEPGIAIHEPRHIARAWFRATHGLPFGIQKD